MFRYILKRLLYAIPVFLGITFVIYTLINLAPGGPLSVLAASGEMSLSDLEALKISMGLDKPIVIRYFIWLGDLLHGDFGISYRVAGAILTESSLSFLGMGVQTPQASWGNIIFAAQNLLVLTARPWVWLPPGICIILVVIGFNFIGEGVRDALDPKTKE